MGDELWGDSLMHLNVKFSNETKNQKHEIYKRSFAREGFGMLNPDGG